MNLKRREAGIWFLRVRQQIELPNLRGLFIHYIKETKGNPRRLRGKVGEPIPAMPLLLSSPTQHGMGCEPMNVKGRRQTRSPETACHLNARRRRNVARQKLPKVSTSRGTSIQ